MNAVRTRPLFMIGVALAGVILGAAGVLLFVRAAGGAQEIAGAASAAVNAPATSVRYHCPMHPSVTSDKPGDCPICGMRMVPTEEDAHAAAAAPAAAKKILYRSTMNPSEISDKPGKDSMGMEMVAEEVDQPMAGGGPAVPGRAPIKLTDQKRQLIGVRTAPVERRPLVRVIRTVGRVTPDETRLRHVHTKISGWVERLFVNATGELVRAGDPLLTIYSPELVASGQEYLLALRSRVRLSGSTLPSIQGTGDDLVESARRRLLLFDITRAQIEEMEEAGEAPRTITLHAPISGRVVTREVTQGQKIDSETNLLDIVDLSRVWVIADVYEYELPFIHEGQEASMTLSYLPGRTFAGKISLVYPVLSEATRTVKIRLEFPNADAALKPEMFAQVEIRSDLGTKIVVPSTAVISTGERDLVFVQRGEGYFEPRAVKLGVRLPDAFEVIEGLAGGEQVVVNGNFLVDSESSMKAALSAAGGGQP